MDRLLVSMIEGGRPMADRECVLIAGDLQDKLLEILRDAVARGLKPPLLLQAVSANGSRLILWQKDPGGACGVVDEHIESDGVEFPVIAVILDRRNEAARVTLTVSEETWH
jgi:hypothetical protein